MNVPPPGTADIVFPHDKDEENTLACPRLSEQAVRTIATPRRRSCFIFTYNAAVQPERAFSRAIGCNGLLCSCLNCQVNLNSLVHGSGIGEKRQAFTGGKHVHL
jgi:hypothetical protein